MGIILSLSDFEGEIKKRPDVQIEHQGVDFSMRL